MKNIFFLSTLLIFIGCDSAETDNRDDAAEVLAEDSVITDSVLTEEIPEFVIPSDLIFGFPNMAGNEVLMIGEPEGATPEDFKQIFDEVGGLTGITYQGVKASDGNDNHRQTPYNFDGSAGHHYKVDKAIDEWQTVVFMGDQFLENRTLIKSKYRTSTQLADEQKEFIERERGWKMDKYKPVSTYENGVCSYFMQFEAQDDSILVSLVFITEDEQIFYRDFPATYNEMSTWRVEDGGEFYFESYQVLGLFESPQGFEIITSWGGAEGSSASYMISEGGYFVEKKGGYLYAAPT